MFLHAHSKHCTAPEMAQLFVDEICYKAPRGLPLSVISDNDILAGDCLSIFFLDVVAFLAAVEGGVTRFCFLAMITGGFEVLAMRFNTVVPHARRSQHRT